MVVPLEVARAGSGPATEVAEAAPFRRPRPRPRPQAILAGLSAAAALLFVLRPASPPTPLAVAPSPSFSPVAATPASTPTATPATTPTTATPASTPTTTTAMKIAIRVTPTPAGDHPGARFGARPNPDATDPRYSALEEGHRLLDERRTAEAVVAYRDLSQANPDFPDAHYWYGYASAMEGNAEGACSGFHQYLLFAPKGHYAKPAHRHVSAFCSVLE